jgi:hypothetical protein
MLFKIHQYDFYKNDLNIYYKEFCDSLEKKDIIINLLKKNVQLIYTAPLNLNYPEENNERKNLFLPLKEYFTTHEWNKFL